MVKKWSGDTSSQLPAQQVEPYRLWFEFLKLASVDPSIEVNKKIYESWGNYDEESFTQWWSPHWRQLFAVDIGVREIRAKDTDILSRTDGEHFIAILIPIHQEPRHSLAQISKILDGYGANARLGNMPSGQFKLFAGFDASGNLIHPSTRFLRNLTKIRLLFHLYRFWLKHEGLHNRKRLERTTLDYFAWADSWNQKIKEKKWNRPTIEIPSAVRVYANYLKRRGSRTRLESYEDNNDHTDHRRQITRYIAKAQRIATNVGQGQFPGHYETKRD